MMDQKLIENYFWARLAYEEAKTLSDIAYKKWRAMEYALVDAMLDEGTKSISREDGTNISLRESFSASVNQDNMDDIRTWLVERFGDDAPYVIEVVSKPALIEMLKTKIADGSLDMGAGEVPEFLDVKTRPALSVRGWKQKKDQA